MAYIVVEIQKSANGSVAVPPINTYEAYEDAAARFHTILASAAVSEVPVHSALILTDTGQEIKLDSYSHETAES